MEAKQTYAQASPAAGSKPPSGSSPIFHTRLPIMVAYGFLIFFGLVIMGLAGFIMHGLVMGENVFALVCSIFTFVIILYAIISEKSSACHGSYNYWAIMSLQLFMTILWLASMAANAALRTTFTQSVDASCYDNGDTFNSGYCFIYKRALQKRVAVATKAGLASMSAIAGLSALQMVLFLAAFICLVIDIRRHRQQNKNNQPGVLEGGPVEMKTQSQPMLNAGVAAAPVAYGQQPVQTYGNYNDSAAQQQQQQPQQTYANYGDAGEQKHPLQQQPQQYGYPTAPAAPAAMAYPSQMYPVPLQTPSPQGYPIQAPSPSPQIPAPAELHHQTTGQPTYQQYSSSQTQDSYTVVSPVQNQY